MRALYEKTLLTDSIQYKHKNLGEMKMFLFQILQYIINRNKFKEENHRNIKLKKTIHQSKKIFMSINAFRKLILN